MQKTYSETLIVRGTDCDMYRRMRMDSLFIAMQEGGERHAGMLGFGHSSMLERGLFFVLARIQLKINRQPRCGETIVHTTWPGMINHFFCPRYHTFTLEDGTPLVTAAALWVILDTRERKIISPLKVDLGFPDNSDIPEPISPNIRLPMLEGDALLSERTPVFSEFDINGHVNNTKYIAWLCDAIGGDILKDAAIGELIANYDKEIRICQPLKQQLVLRDDHFFYRVSAPTGEKHFSAYGSLRKEDNHE